MAYSLSNFPDERLEKQVDDLIELIAAAQDKDGIYTTCKPTETPCTAYAVPYYAWGNRGENQLRVWMPATM